MALDNVTSKNRLLLANALERAAKHVYNNIEHRPVNYPDNTVTALAAAKVLLDSAITA